jgi:hypothetical protein
MRIQSEHKDLLLERSSCLEEVNCFTHITGFITCSGSTFTDIYCNTELQVNNNNSQGASCLFTQPFK